MKAKILSIYPEDQSSVYNYVCQGEDDRLFSFPLEWRYHRQILQREGCLIWRKIEYNDDIHPPRLTFLD